MSTTLPPAECPAEYAAMLTRVLDLALTTAEAASAEGNQRLALQAVREVSRIIALMAKLGVRPERRPAVAADRPRRARVVMRPPASRQGQKRRQKGKSPPKAPSRPQRDLDTEIDKLRQRLWGEDCLPP